MITHTNISILEVRFFWRIGDGKLFGGTFELRNKFNIYFESIKYKSKKIIQEKLAHKNFFILLCITK
jgi:hypothetical protein